MPSELSNYDRSNSQVFFCILIPVSFWLVISTH